MRSAAAIDWARSGRHEITVAADGDRLRVRVEDLDEELATRSLSIGANIKISGLDQVVKPVIQRFANLSDEVEAYVGEED